MLVHRRIQAWLQANPFKVDAALMLFCVLIFVVSVAAVSARPVFDMLLSLGIVVPLAWRRTRPALSGSITAFFCLVQVFFSPSPLPADFTALATVYALAAYAPRWASLGGLVLALVGGMLFVFRYFANPLEGLGSVSAAMFVFNVIAFDAVILVAWTFGDLARTRRLALQALEDRARRLETERQQERDLAAADERTHIAREMHDIVAHSLSVIITQADGARYASAQDPEIAAKTLGTIAETGRASLREMRRLLGVLRGDELASTRPLPSLADVDSLVDAVKRAGLEVNVNRKGSMRRQLPAGAELTAYRVIQESLTNVLKHAGPSVRAEVELEWTSRGLEVRVHDDGRGAGADGPPLPPGSGSGSGQGINGMAERVALYDGKLVAAPAAGGGFRVTAFIPYTEA